MRVAVLGASGLVGRRMLELLEDCSWLEGEPLALTSARSAGKTLTFRGQGIVCQEVDADSFHGCDLALFSAGGGASRTWAPVAVDAGCVVIDNSSAWRQDPHVPLVVPEINGHLVKPGPGVIANPNCSTIQIAMAVAPLDRLFGVVQCHATTLQAVSGAGQAAQQELLRQTRDFPRDDQVAHVFPRPMAFNALPAIGKPTASGGYEEETKVLLELRRILGRGDDLQVSCTAVRVPVLTGHSVAIRVVCERPVSPQAAVSALSEMPGVVVHPGAHDYSTAREVAGSRDVFVGRVRQTPGSEHSLLMWVVADNLLKGAAWNAIQIAGLLAGENS